jgi:hypothetical protein
MIDRGIEAGEPRYQPCCSSARNFFDDPAINASSNQQSVNPIITDQFP